MTQYTFTTPNGVAFRNDNIVTIANTAAETALVTGTIKGGILSLTSRMKSTLYLAVASRALLPGTITFRVKYGTNTLVLGGGALALIASVSAGPVELFCRLANHTTFNNQVLYGKVTQGSGALTLSSPINIASLVGTIDSTVDQTFSITAQFSASDAANTISMLDFEMEIS